METRSCTTLTCSARWRTYHYQINQSVLVLNILLDIHGKRGAKHGINEEVWYGIEVVVVVWSGVWVDVSMARQ